MTTPRFHVIIRKPGTTGPDDIHCGFFAQDKVEGRVRLQEQLAMLIDPRSWEVQIFDLQAD